MAGRACSKTILLSTKKGGHFGPMTGYALVNHEFIKGHSFVLGIFFSKGQSKKDVILSPPYRDGLLSG
jgi:hypothetical protein